ncbi:hypothetical protein CAL18_17340 [Bordetella genomosp. 7]|jgi:uncharacterized alpha-E superfamily protein|uniref:DUF403 domain-containing protein n=1 Tax=Bordetella genomosp. 7 TaxID=1416805 RepID=A0A261QUT7_9BORD|nr:MULTISPECIES: alpha-E domain-containing protein [Bordetella]OZI15739.1 hypothetical protein CAL18_17340 [Bordetella genomosp. 7]OZI16491.1 hypothetical protein CAL19_17585 [Bordetella genomosp. 7]
MLSRTADHLFWMCRYIERAENTARMLDVNLQMSLLPQDDQAGDTLWSAVLRISELQSGYDARYPAVTPMDVLHYMVREPSNQSSIYACLHAARENARAVRGSLTTEVWETYNATWLELQRHLQDQLPERNPAKFFEWVKFRAHVARGVTIGTMLEDEALYFMRLGMNLERADNTARLLDVKFHEADGDTPARASEFYRWSALLSSLSGLEIYRKVYRDIMTPDRVAELLILRPDMPRSLLATVQALTEDLTRVSNQWSAETERRAGLLHAELRYGRIEDILRSGLHRYLERFLERINDLGDRISRDFLVSLAA